MITKDIFKILMIITLSFLLFDVCEAAVKEPQLELDSIWDWVTMN